MKTCVFAVETWFALNRNMNHSNDRYRCFKNPLTFMKFSCLTPEVGIWCAVSAHKITGPMSLEEAVNSVYYVHFNHTHFILDFAKGGSVW
jgi:hypothetical protein